MRTSKEAVREIAKTVALGKSEGYQSHITYEETEQWLLSIQQGVTIERVIEHGEIVVDVQDLGISAKGFADEKREGLAHLRRRLESGEIGAIYCPLGGEFLMHNTRGVDHWKKDEFNKVRIRIDGNPPYIWAWLNGVRVVDYADTLVAGEYRVPESGHIGLQVHPGESWGRGNKVYFRRIMVKEL